MQHVELTDSRLHIRVEGVGEPLLFVPGLGGTLPEWEGVLDQLAASFAVVAAELRGVGESHAKRPARTIHDYVADLVELLDHLQIDRAHVIGTSLGGIVAQRFAIDHPQRVKRLVLVSTAHRFGPYLREVAALLGDMLRRVNGKRMYRMLEMLGRAPMFIDEHPDWFEAAIQRERSKGVTREQVMHQLHCLMSSGETIAEDYDILNPTLVIAGDHDRIIPAWYSEQMAAAIPGSRYELLAHAGHNPLHECPSRTVPLIASFLIDSPYLIYRTAGAGEDSVHTMPEPRSRGGAEAAEIGGVQEAKSLG